MDLSNISAAGIVASQMAMIQDNVGMLVLRKALDTEAMQGAMLAKMMDQASGLGQNVDTQA